MSSHVRALGAVLVATALIVLAVPGLAPAVTPVWQNPQLAPNPFNNIHNDSFLSDNYTTLGPRSTRTPSVRQINRVDFVDPETGHRKRFILGECGAITFDRSGNVVSICAGVPTPHPGGGWNLVRHIIAFNRDGVVQAYTSFTAVAKSLNAAVSDVSPGYFYLDDEFRPVVALPDGRVQVLARVPSRMSPVDAYVPVRSIRVTGDGGAVPIRNLKLYALMPAPDGTIWFTTSQAVVGTIAPDSSVKWLDLNDRGGHRITGNDAEQIANSHAVDRSGDAYVVTTHRIYRLSYRNRHVHVVWQAGYPRGPMQKPGQLSHGSGTSPTLFEMAGRGFVTIADNAERMNVIVYRTAAHLKRGQHRVFARVTPFGKSTLVSDENSLVWTPGPQGGRGAAIFAENNWGNENLQSTVGRRTTQPGVARLELKPNGTFKVAALNEKVAVPSVVSKYSQASRLFYTYEKRKTGWYLTALDGNTLKRNFSVFVGKGRARNNNFYAGLSLDPNGRTIWIGTTYGATRITP